MIEAEKSIIGRQRFGSGLQYAVQWTTLLKRTIRYFPYMPSDGTNGVIV